MKIELVLERKEVLLADHSISEKRKKKKLSSLEKLVKKYEEELAKLNGGQGWLYSRRLISWSCLQIDSASNTNDK